MELNRFIKITIWDDNNTYTNEDGSFGITQGSMSLEEIICDNELTFGQLFSNKFECQLFSLHQEKENVYELITQENENITDQQKDSLLIHELSDSYPNFCGMNIKVEIITSDDIIPVFTGIIDSSTTDNFDDYRDIVAYDNSYIYKDKDIVDIYKDFWEDESITVRTLKNLKLYILNKLNIEYIDKTLPNDDILIFGNTNDYQSITFGQLLSAICELECCFPNFNRENKLEFITLDNTSKIISNYEKTNAKFEDYTTKIATGIKVFSTSDNIVQQFPSDDVGVNPFSISGNVLLLNSDPEVIVTICSAILNVLYNITYTPCELPLIVSDFGIPGELEYQNIQLGNRIYTDNGYHYVFKNSYSGSLLINQTISCQATGEYFSDKPSSKNDLLATARKFSRLEQNLESITSSVGDLNSSISELRQTSDSITGSVTTIENVLEGAMDDGKLVATIVKTEEGFTFDKTGLTISKSGSNITTTINEEGMTISSSGTELLTAKSESGGRAAGVEAYRLKATGYISIGNNTRIMDFIDNEGKSRTGFFWVEEG